MAHSGGITEESNESTKLLNMPLVRFLDISKSFIGVDGHAHAIV